MLIKGLYWATILFWNYRTEATFLDFMLLALLLASVEGENVHQRTMHKASLRLIKGLKEEIQNNINYVAGVVHDLRNPLTEIYSCAELLG